jgi:hypothetical protein
LSLKLSASADSSFLLTAQTHLDIPSAMIPITIKASSAALPSLAPSCGVLLHTPQSSLLGALHLTACW